MKFRTVTAVLIVSIMLGLSAGCGSETPTTENGAVKPEGELKIALAELPFQILDPFFVPSTPKGYIEVMYDWLIYRGEDGQYDPSRSVAYKWESSPDFMTWTFYIRDGITFSNGEPLTNEDVKFTIERESQKTLYAGANLRAVLGEPPNITLEDPDKVVIHLPKAYAFLPWMFSNGEMVEGMIQPKDYIEENGDEYFAQHPIGSGPYILKENVTGDHITFEALDNHWRIGVPKYKYITFSVVNEEDVRIARLKTGEADLIDLGLQRAQELEDAGYTKFTGSVKVAGIVFTDTYKDDCPFSDINVRKALAMAINKQEIIDTLFLGQGRLTGEYPAVKGTLGWEDLPAVPYDLDEAKTLLDEAGYSNGFKVDVYSYAYGIPEGQLMMEAIAGYWRELGLDTNVIKTEYATWSTLVTKDEITTPSVGWYGLSSRYYFADTVAWYVVRGSSAPALVPHDDTVESLVATWKEQTDEDAYAAAADVVHRYIYDHYWFIAIAEVPTIYMADDKIPAGWEVGTNFYDYNMDYLMRSSSYE